MQKNFVICHKKMRLEARAAVTFLNKRNGELAYAFRKSTGCFKSEKN